MAGAEHQQPEAAPAQQFARVSVLSARDPHESVAEERREHRHGAAVDERHLHAGDEQVQRAAVGCVGAETGDLIAALTLLTDWMQTASAGAVLAITSERHRYPELAEALYRKVFDPRGGSFTTTVLRHYAASGQVDPTRLTPITTQIGEALVFKLSIDLARRPTPEELAAIVDEAMLPALGL